MSALQLILCNQYHEITKKDKDGKSALLNTHLLLTAVITIYILVILYFIDIFTAHSLQNNIHAGEVDGSTLGKIFGLLCGGLIYLLLKSVKGRDWYESTIAEFNACTAGEQEVIAKKGLRIFMYGFIPVILILLLIAIGIL